MIYLYCYFGVGVATLLMVFIFHALTQTTGDKRFKELMSASKPKYNSWLQKMAFKVVAPILATVISIVAWPVAIFMKAHDGIESRKNRTKFASKDIEVAETVGGSLNKVLRLQGAHTNSVREPPKEFCVAIDHLQQKLSIADVETAETIYDPLDAVPRLPFGHLNPAWENFKHSIREGDDIWSFSARWATGWGEDELREGYVVVRDGSIGAYFLTLYVALEQYGELWLGKAWRKI